jgi:hypothetical protein
MCLWYIMQFIIAATVAYFWTSIDGNSPSDLGHGLFLGFCIAWYATLLIVSIKDLPAHLRKGKTSLPTLPTTQVVNARYRRRAFYTCLFIVLWCMPLIKFGIGAEGFGAAIIWLPMAAILTFTILQIGTGLLNGLLRLYGYLIKARTVSSPEGSGNAINAASWRPDPDAVRRGRLPD